MRNEPLLDTLSPSLREPFRRFVSEGVSTPELEEAIENDPAVKAALEQEFQAQCEAFERFGRELRGSTLPYRHAPPVALWYALLLLLGVLTRMAWEMGPAATLLALLASLSAGVLFVQRGR